MAALAGASIAVVDHLLHLPSTPVALAGALVCFGIRIMAIYRRWQFPVARTSDPAQE